MARRNKPRPPAEPVANSPLTRAAPPERPSFARRVGDVLALDARSLALFRIGLGLWLLADLFQRSLDLTSHYTDAGVLPRIPRIGVYDLPAWADQKYWVSLHLANGTPAVVRLLFVLAAVAYGCLVVGFRTRLAAVVTYLFHASLHSRNPAVCDGSDDLTRSLLFWAMFLPLGGRFSVDAAAGRCAAVPDRVLSVASVALLVQLGFVYFFSAAAKSDPSWNREYTAVYYVLNADCLANSVGRAVAPYHGLTGVMTFAAYWLELLGPLVLLIPWKTAYLRLAVAAGFVGFHLGLFATMWLGIFPIAACLMWTVVLPPLAWDTRPGRWVQGREWSPYLSRLVAAARAQPPVPGRLSWAATVFVAGVGLLVVGWNVREVRPGFVSVFPREVNPVVRFLRVDQTWAFFAPKPITDDGWYVMQGTLADGTKVNLWDEDAPLAFDKPADVAGPYTDQRWRKYLLNLQTDSHRNIRVDFCHWLAQEWQARHPRGVPLTKVELLFMMERTPPPGEPFPPVERQVLWTLDVRPAR